MPVAVVTRAVMAKPRFIPRFVRANLICTIQARRTAGFLNGTLAFSPRGRVFWTLTVWEDGPAMMRFRESGPHLKLMPKMVDWGSEASTAAWKVADGRLPTWDEAHEALRTRAKFATVAAPNDNQRNGVITERSRVIVTLPLLRRRVIESSSTAHPS
jgi:uncharacterized protein DUF3291